MDIEKRAIKNWRSTATIRIPIMHGRATANGSFSRVNGPRAFSGSFLSAISMKAAMRISPAAAATKSPLL